MFLFVRWEETLKEVKTEGGGHANSHQSESVSVVDRCLTTATEKSDSLNFEDEKVKLSHRAKGDSGRKMNSPVQSSWDTREMVVQGMWGYSGKKRIQSQPLPSKESWAHHLALQGVLLWGLHLLLPLQESLLQAVFLYLTGTYLKAGSQYAWGHQVYLSSSEEKSGGQSCPRWQHVFGKFTRRQDDGIETREAIVGCNFPWVSLSFKISE